MTDDAVVWGFTPMTVRAIMPYRGPLPAVAPGGTGRRPRRALPILAPRICCSPRRAHRADCAILEYSADEQRADHDPCARRPNAIPWVGPRACPGLHFSDTGEPRGEAELPSGKKTEGTGPQGAPAGEAATSLSSPGRSRREPRGEPVGSVGDSA